MLTNHIITARPVRGAESRKPFQKILLYYSGKRYLPILNVLIVHWMSAAAHVSIIFHISIHITTNCKIYSQQQQDYKLDNGHSGWILLCCCCCWTATGLLVQGRVVLVWLLVVLLEGGVVLPTWWLLLCCCCCTTTGLLFWLRVSMIGI